MSYIGNQPTNLAFVTDQFSGTGSQTAFTMSVAPANTASVLVAVTGVLQDPTTYSVSGTTLTFSAAPPAGTGNISVRYLGIPASGVTTTAYRTVTQFTATSGQTTFSPPSYTVGYIDVYRNGLRLGAADYTATNGTSVVLAVGATAGDLITTESFYVSSVTNAIPAVGGAVNTTYLDAGNQNGTGSMIVPSGTTAQRPAATTAGQVRYNSTTGALETYQSSSWNTVTVAYSVDYLVVAGGGGGGGDGPSGDFAGGGGAGGFLTGSASIISGTAYSITVGSGGSGGPAVLAGVGTSGNNSVFGGVTSIGGGGGGAYSSAPLSGGSGGGAGNGTYQTSVGSGTAGQGNNGGTTTASAGAGGGGAGAVGSNGSGTTGGAGGVGLTSSYSGASVYYAGGGGGAGSSAAGAGGNGGGGAGAVGNAVGSNATVNTGGGGGGAAAASGGYTGGNGGSGIVIIRYPGSQRATGGTVTSSGGYTIHTFTSSGTLTA